tara:strand:- start:10142 stop:10903 length:762 start_codon:yes stop_codon:yes gene_type:complete
MRMRIDSNPFIEEIFNKKCGRLFIDPENLNRESYVLTFKEKVKELRYPYQFIECILPTDALAVAVALFSIDFILVCIQTIFEKSLENLVSQNLGNIRRPEPSEYPAIAQVAGDSFKFDRYSQDQQLPKASIKALYSQWIKNSLSGSVDFVLTDGSSFCSCKKIGREGWIDLIAVPENKRGKGIGKRLVLASLWELKQRGCDFCKVKTELLNLGGVRLYEGLGFKLFDSCLALHWHGDLKSIEKNLSRRVLQLE